MTSTIKTEYDLLVVGAGIYGAWAAYDATLRGLKVLVIDKGDIANATSSASSKLIHGGLRYLEQFNFSLVKTSIKERQSLFEIAPHRVKPLTFGIPVLKKSRVPAWKYKIGLTVYDWFANLKEKKFKHHTYSQESFLEKFPCLKSENLTKGFTYLDANTDDFRYTFEIVDEAVRLGADLKTYCELISYRFNNDTVCGAAIKLPGDLNETIINSKAVINATGQWTDRVFDINACRLSKGIHIVIPSLELNEALLLLSPVDERVFFILPWYGKTMVGTTDTDYQGSIDNVTADEKDIDYLLKSINYFLRKEVTKEEIISSFAGLRVLKNENGHPSSVTRDWECREQHSGLFISLGGKLTSARHDSAIMVDKVCETLHLYHKCHTAQIPFPWSVPDYERWTGRMKERGLKLGLSEAAVTLLLNRQGKRAKEIFKLIETDSELKEPLIKGLHFTLAEWKFVIENEHVTKLEDLIRRRFPLILLKKLSGIEVNDLKESANKILCNAGMNELV